MTAGRHLCRVLVFVLFLPGTGKGGVVELPLQLDFPLLEDLMVQEIFKGPGGVVVLPGNACSWARISTPRFSSVKGLLRLRVNLSLQAGTMLGEHCVPPLQWSGILELDQRVVVGSDDLSLRFVPVESRLFDGNGREVVLADLLWDFAKPRVHGELARFAVDLAPPLGQVKDFLDPFVKSAGEAAGDGMEMAAVSSALLPKTVRVGEHGIGVSLEMSVPDRGNHGAGTGPEAAAGNHVQETDQARLSQLWEVWDVLLVRLLEVLATSELAKQDRQLLIDVLLEARYGFQATLEQGQIEDSFVRGQFLRAWERLAPVFRRQLFGKHGSGGLGYLAFVTAADGLATLDRLGPAFNIEISRDGLLQLAAMLALDDRPLVYSAALDNELRKLFEMETETEKYQEETVPAESSREQPEQREKEAGRRRNPLSSLLDYLVSPGMAAPLPGFQEILRWKVPSGEKLTYVHRVRAVVLGESGKVRAGNQLAEKHRELFDQLTDAMAWQESCYRQFTVRGGKLTYLLSYNGTSVGLMQVHERVWRGIYNRDRLRWDIRYNARAGCEIARLYLVRYVLPRLGAGAEEKLLAGAVYALYNGGPGQLDRYLKRFARGKLYRTDKLFRQKFDWVRGGQWQKVSVCLGS